MENSIFLKTVLIEKSPFWVTILEYDKNRYEAYKGYDESKWWYHFNEKLIGKKILVNYINDFEDLCLAGVIYVKEDVYIIESGLYSGYVIFKKDCKRVILEND